jgi:biotin carboxyl carrier protein
MSYRRRRRGALMAGAAAAAVLVLVSAAVAVGSRLQSPEQAAAQAAPPPASLITVAAERRVLVEAVVLRGEVRPGDSKKVRVPAAAAGPDSVVTQVLVEKGQSIEEGQVLLARAGQPMFTLVLPFPLYRDLAGGMVGPDVGEVQKALERTGHPVPATGSYDAATSRAVERFYTDRGFAAPSGDPEALAGLPAARDAVVVAQAGYDEAVSAAAGVAEADAALAQAKRDLARLELAAGPGLPRAAVVQLSRAAGTVTAVRVRVGDILDEPNRVLCELNGGAAYVTATAALDQYDRVAVGQEAVITDEATGRDSAAVVEDVGDEPVNDERSGLSGFPIRMAFTGEPLEPVDDRTVRVDLQAAADDAPVLAVPLTAVYSRADGHTFVTMLRCDQRTPAPSGRLGGCPDGIPVDLPVTTGQIAGGWVAVEPTGDLGLEPGDLVVVGHGEA